MTEQRGDRVERHAPVDGLGCQGVAEPVRVEVADPGATAEEVAHACDGVSADGLAVLGEQAARGVGWGGGAPVLDELDEVGVQGDVAVVAQLADRDA